MRNTNSLEPEIKGLLGTLGFGAIAILLGIVIMEGPYADLIHAGVLLFLLGTGMFLGSIWVSRSWSLKRAKQFALAGLFIGALSLLWVGWPFLLLWRGK